MGGDDLAEARGDGVEGLVPGDAREAPLALGPDALHRMQDAVGAVDALEVVVDLRAEEALGEPVIGVAADAHRAAVLDVHGHHAGVGAVVRTDDLQPLARRHGGRHARYGSASRIGVGWPFSSTATSTTSASVTFTFSPRPAPQRSASTDTFTVIEVRPTRTVSV